MNRNLNPQEFGEQALPRYGEEDFPYRSRAAQYDLREEKARRVGEWQRKGEEDLNKRIGEEVELLDPDDKGKRVPAGRARFAGSQHGTAQIEFPDGHTEPRPYGGYRFTE